MIPVGSSPLGVLVDGRERAVAGTVTDTRLRHGSHGGPRFSSGLGARPPRGRRQHLIVQPSPMALKRARSLLRPPSDRFVAYRTGHGHRGKWMSLRTAGDRNKFAQQLFADLPARYDRLAEWLSFGQNGRWRTAMVDRIVPASPKRVLDVASGTAGVALQLADRTSAHIVGVDLTRSMLRIGQRNIAQAHQTRRVQLVNGRAETLPFPDAAFDALTFTYLFRYVDDPQATLNELARVVKPGAPVASLEFMVPPTRFWRGWWWVYTRFVLPAAGSRDGRAGVVPGGPFPRAEHLEAVRAVSRSTGRSRLGARPASRTSACG